MTGAAPRALILGAGGQVGHELLATAPDGWLAVGLTSADLDIRHAAAVRDVVRDDRPAVVINAAGYTAVDAAEANPELAMQVNAVGAGHVAEAACAVGARTIYLSTDYVFDGAQRSPYLPTDAPRPLSAYGRSKLAGEEVVRRIAGQRATVVRTAWVYSGRGRNFVRTMLQLMRDQDQVGVVSDQVGTPTWARPLAAAVWALAARPDLGGVVHWTDAGVASWHEFAVAIRDEALAVGLLDRATPVRPLATHEYPAAARRPPFSVLNTSATCEALGMAPAHWRTNLRRLLLELRGA